MRFSLLRVLLVAAAVIVLFVVTRYAFASSVEIGAELSHPGGAVAGQEVELTWRVTRATVPITRCTLGQRDPNSDDDPWVTELTDSTWAGKEKLTMPSHELQTAITCYWQDGDQELSFMSVQSVPLADTERLATPPACYPSPIGPGTFPALDVDDGVLCGAWHCPVDGGTGYTAHGFCGDLAELWSVERVMALSPTDADAAWSEHDWLALSEYERQRLMQLAAKSQPAPPTPPPPRYVTKGDGDREDVAVFIGKADGTRGYDRAGRVAVGTPCDCERTVTFPWGNWCYVETDAVNGFANCEALGPE